jgi:hypothetical protein
LILSDRWYARNTASPTECDRAISINSGRGCEGWSLTVPAWDGPCVSTRGFAEVDHPPLCQRISAGAVGWINQRTHPVLSQQPAALELCACT